MLVLNRKVNQSIIIDDVIEVRIIETKGDQVKIGVIAPKEITVFRAEIYEEIQKENLRASQSEIPNDFGDLFSSPES